MSQKNFFVFISSKRLLKFSKVLQIYYIFVAMNTIVGVCVIIKLTVKIYEFIKI